MNYWQVFVFFGAMWTKMCFMYSYLSTFISDRLNTILSNNERTETSFFEHWTTQTCSFIGDRTRTPFFWLRTNEHRTSNLIRLSLNLLNYSSNWLEHHFFEHRTNSNVFIYWKSNSNTLFLPSNDRTSNFEHSSTHH